MPGWEQGKKPALQVTCSDSCLRTWLPRQWSMSSSTPQGLRKWKVTLTLPLLSTSKSVTVSSLVTQTVKCLPTIRADQGSIPGSGRLPGEGNGNPLQYSCLENSMDSQRSLECYSPWGSKESDWVTSLSFFLSLYLVIFPQKNGISIFPFPFYLPTSDLIYQNHLLTILPAF